MRSRLLIIAGSCLLAATSTGVYAAPLATSYTIDILGFTDIEHTRSNGYRDSSVSYLNAAGQAAGIAERYNGTTTNLGQSVWLYDGSSTANVGLIGTGYTRDDGYRKSFLVDLNQAGQVGGSSNRYNGATWLGQSAWLYNGASTVKLGLTDAEHTRVDGWQVSIVDFISQAGKVAGYSARYQSGSTINWGSTAWLYNGTSTTNIGLTDAEHTSGNGSRISLNKFINQAGMVAGVANRYDGSFTDIGETAWLYNGTATVNIGLTDAEHTRNNGYRFSRVEFLNEAGQAAGKATRFNGDFGAGFSVWLYNGTGTANIGLTDIEHTRNDGYRASQIEYLNQAGQAAGIAQRFNGGGTNLGNSSWLYNGTSTIIIGLTDAEHTRDDGFQNNRVNFLNPAIGKTNPTLNEAGQVVGNASRYNGGSTSMGWSAWLYNGTSTINVGLTDAEHTRNDGYRSSTAELLNQAGQVAGSASRYNGATSLGPSAWMYDGTSTVRIGLTGAEYTRDDGVQFNFVDFLNEAGQVAGSAWRYNGGAAAQGQSAWLYDMTLGQTFALDLSIRSDGYAYSEALYMGDDGLILGQYELYDTNDSLLGTRAFAFTLEDGAVDLGGLIDGGLNFAGWDSLASAFNANDMGQIIGSGLLSDMSNGSMGYILTPTNVVPVPPAVWLFGSGLLGMIGIARRKKAA